MPQRRRTTKVLGSLVAVLVFVACQGAEQLSSDLTSPATLVVDLAEELGVATIESEPRIIDLGEPEARPFLRDGWGVDEKDGDGSYVWSLGETASSSFFVATPVDFELVLRCSALTFEGAPEQVMTVALNGQKLGDLQLIGELKEHEIAVPESVVIRGSNQLDLSFAYHRRPQEFLAGSTDSRSLAARCYEIELRGLGSSGTAKRIAAEGLPSGEQIELPVGTMVTYFFDARLPTELVIDEISAYGSAAKDVRLLVRARSADSATELDEFFDSGEVAGPLRLSLPTASYAIDSLQIAAVSRRHEGWRRWLRTRLGSRKPSGLILTRPAVHRESQTQSAQSPNSRGLSTGLPNVLIYLIDTLRADHLGVYGYERPTSPNIDRFAADSIVFRDAQAQSSWTRPAVASLLTGLRARRHGVNQRTDALPAAVEALPSLLARHGYDTAAFVTNGNAGPDFGLDQGFAEYRYLRESGEDPERHRLSDHLNEWLFDWLESRGRDASPFFLYAHATDPHAPYTPREPFRQRFAPNADPKIGLLEEVHQIFRGERPASEKDHRDLIDLYDAEIAFNDHHFGLLMERLKELGLYDSTLIVLLSDHGEEFLDHQGWEHGKTLYGEQLNVPLIVKLPGNRAAGTVVEATVSQIDVLPTVLEVAGLPPAAAIDGRSLLDTADRSRDPAFAYLSLNERSIRSIQLRNWKLILDDSPFPRGERIQLFHVEEDEGETVELARQHPFERELLAQTLRRWELELATSDAVSGEVAEIPDELRRQLEALGYL